MKISKLIGLGILVSTGALTGLKADTITTNLNPAFYYYQSFLVGSKTMPEKDSDYLGSYEGRNNPLPDRFKEYVEGSDSQYRFLRSAACSTATCEWGIDFGRGPSTMLPHLGRAKAAAVESRHRVRWQLEHNQQAQACDDLIAALALGRNVAHDGTLIGTLVQLAIENIEYQVIAENFGQFSPESLQKIAKGLDSIAPRTSGAACMTTERTMFYDWTLRKIADLKAANPGDDAKVLSAIEDMFLVNNSDEGTNQNAVMWAQALKASGGTSDGMVKLIQDTASYFPKLTTVLQLPHGQYEPQIEQLLTEVNKLQNPFPKLMFTPLSKVHSREFRTYNYEAMVRAAIAYKLEGEAGLKKVADPCGKDPFAFRRFTFEGVDRGFELKSAYVRDGQPEVMIFVEKPGGFRVNGVHPGERLPSFNGK